MAQKSGGAGQAPATSEPSPKRPSFQFYPSDWRNDPGLRLCGVPARGLWIEMTCLMHAGQPYGHLTVTGRKIEISMLARLVGEPVEDVTAWHDELEANNVFSRTAEGVIFSRRMIRDEELRQKRRAGGEAGAEHGHKGAEHGKKGGRPCKTPLPETGRGVPKPSPSSSSASSSAFASEEEAPSQERGQVIPMGGAR